MDDFNIIYSSSMLGVIKSHINLVHNLAGYGVPCNSVDKEFENDNRLEIITLN